MPSPIYRVIIEFGYKTKGSVRQYKYSKIDTFVLTDDVELIKVNESLLQKIKRKVNAKKEIDITFKNIYVEGQYGFTNY
tara:strand:- start:1169 stop:1405 length:237 start_codon:yes stop_codon:yes gene_type:complete